MKILLGYFNAKVGGENIFRPTVGNESLNKWVYMLQVRLAEILYCSIICWPVVTVLLPLPSGTDFHVVSMVSWQSLTKKGTGQWWTEASSAGKHEYGGKGR
jgi:hypothetical protein